MEDLDEDELEEEDEDEEDERLVARIAWSRLARIATCSFVISQLHNDNERREGERDTN